MDTNKLNSKEDSISDVVYGYTKYWFYFFLSVLAFIISASIFLRYANPIYSVSSTIIIKDEKSGGGAAELAALTDLSFFSNFSSSKIDSELTILESKTLIAKTVENLGLNVRYFNQGTFKTTELYEYKPFIIKFQDVSQTNIALSWHVHRVQLHSQTRAVPSHPWPRYSSCRCLQRQASPLEGQ